MQIRKCYGESDELQTVRHEKALNVATILQSIYKLIANYRKKALTNQQQQQKKIYIAYEI